MRATSDGVRWAGLCELEPMLRAWLARRCRDRAEIDDVLHDTWLRAARFRAQQSDPERLRGWLLRVASNALRDRARAEGRARAALKDDGELDSLPAPGCVREAPADESAVRVEGVVVPRELARVHLQHALDALRPADREILLDYYGGGTTCAQAAAARGVSAETLKMRLFRARQRLTRVLAARLVRAAAREERRP